MTKLPFEFQYDIQAMPYWDEEAQQWYPSVKVLFNGNFFSWTVYRLGFDEARFTMPYARELARETAKIFVQSSENFKADLQAKWGNS